MRRDPISSSSPVIGSQNPASNFGWIDGLPLDEDGLPPHRRGVSTDLPGLRFMGLPFQYGLTSALIGGVTREAVFLAQGLARTRTPAHL